MPLYLYVCEKCEAEYDIECRVDERMGMHGQVCPDCREGRLMKQIGNRGGFRLGPNGNIGWANDGYATTHGDAENFKAKSKGLPEPFPRDIGKQ